MRLLCLGFSSCRFGFLYREIHGMDCVSGAHLNTFLAEFTLLIVNVGKIGVDCYGFVRTVLGTLSASYACYLACFHRKRAFLLVGACHEHAHTSRTLVAQFDYRARTSLYACTAAHALFLDYFRQSGLKIHSHGTPRTCFYAVAAPETAVGAG